MRATVITRVATEKRPATYAGGFFVWAGELMVGDMIEPEAMAPDFRLLGTLKRSEDWEIWIWDPIFVEEGSRELSGSKLIAWQVKPEDNFHELLLEIMGFIAAGEISDEIRKEMGEGAPDPSQHTRVLFGPTSYLSTLRKSYKDHVLEVGELLGFGLVNPDERSADEDSGA